MTDLEGGVFSISRRVLILSVILLFVSGVFSMATPSPDGILFQRSLTFTFLVIIVHCLTPGLLFVTFPAVGYAWLRGGFSRHREHKAWNEISDRAALGAVLMAVVLFAFGMTLLYILITKGWLG